MSEITGEMRRGRFVVWTLPVVGAFSVIYALTAWMCDDAYITHRSLDNLLAGNGLRWQAAERVQSFTHPLWLFLMAPGRIATGEAYYSTLLLSFLVSAASLIGIFYLARTWLPYGYALIVVALLSQAFVDYSSSGLENPLSHLLGVLIVGVAMRRPGEAGPVEGGGAVALTGLAGLAVLNRFDVVVLYAPVVLVSLFPGLNRRTVGWCVVAGSPFILWTLFSLFYYGFPFPNTAYAKAIHAGVPPDIRILNALAYFQATLEADPITLLSMWGICIGAFFTRSRRAIAIALGIVLYQAYLFRIGGDFMRGRFFTVPFVVALALAASFEGDWLRKAMAGLLLLLIIGTVATFSPHERLGRGFGSKTDNPRDFLDESGIADERAYYYPVTGLLSVVRKADHVRSHAWYRIGEAIGSSAAPVVAVRAAGFVGYGVNEHQYTIDLFGLNDPLIARLPGFNDERWRPGHPSRRLPRGYVETHIHGENRIEDADIRAYYALIRSVTRDALWSRDRLRAVWALNSGSARSRVDFRPYVDPKGRQWFPLSRHYASVEAFNADAPILTFGDRLFIHLEDLPERYEIHATARHQKPVTLILMANDEDVVRLHSDGVRNGSAGVTHHTFVPPARAFRRRVNAFALFARATDYSSKRFVPSDVVPDAYQSIEIRERDAVASGQAAGGQADEANPVEGAESNPVEGSGTETSADAGGQPGSQSSEGDAADGVAEHSPRVEDPSI